MCVWGGGGMQNISGILTDTSAQTGHCFEMNDQVVFF